MSGQGANLDPSHSPSDNEESDREPTAGPSGSLHPNVSTRPKGKEKAPTQKQIIESVQSMLADFLEKQNAINEERDRRDAERDRREAARDKIINSFRNSESTHRQSQERLPTVTGPSETPHQSIEPIFSPRNETAFSTRIREESQFTERPIPPRIAIPTLAEPELGPFDYRTTRTPQSKLTEKIEPLDDGTKPTYRQWQISIRDRFTVNSDHYVTDVARMALVWGTTTGLARTYLEPRYQSDSPQGFQTAEEMISLLKSFFLTGYETEDARSAFQALRMGEKGHENESFAEFRARFTSMATLGEVPHSEQFYNMWLKLTPSLRSQAAVQKRGWNNSLSAMIADLIALDKERKHNAELNSLANKISNTASSYRTPIKSGTSNKTFTSQRQPYKPFIPIRLTTAEPSPPNPSRPTTSLDRLKSDTQPTTDSVCFHCKKPGHWAKNCPSKPTIKEIGESQEPDEQEEEFFEAFDTDQYREGNDEA